MIAVLIALLALLLTFGAFVASNNGRGRLGMALCLVGVGLTTVAIYIDFLP